MSRIRQYGVATATFSFAMAIGFVMQNGDALAARFSEVPPPPASSPAVDQAPAIAPPATAVAAMPAVHDPAPARADAPQNAALVVPATPPAGVTAGPMVPGRPDAATAHALPSGGGMENATPPPKGPGPDAIMLARLDLDTVPSRPLSPPLPPEAACTATLSASVLPAALVRLTLSAPCAPSAQVNITHEGMLFSVVTDATGRATALAPALTASAVFQADLGEDGDASVAVTVPDVNDYDRAVLQWRGLAGPEIHAREFGADYGTPGHVWHGAPRTADVAVAGTGGFLMRLGDGQGPNPQMAEVFTFPSIATRQSGKVAFSIETPVSPRTCGHDLKARTIQASPGAEPFASDLTIAVPDCQFVGELLILRDVILNLTVAAR